MNKFHFVSARPESATQSALHQSRYNSKTAGNQSFSLNKFNILRATTALASILAMGLGIGPLFLGIGTAVLAPNAAHADDATSLGDTATADVIGNVQPDPDAGDHIIVDGGGTAIYTYDGTNDADNVLESIGFLDVNADGEPDGHSSGALVAGTLNVLSGTSASEETAQATNSSDNSDAKLTINGNIGGTYSYTDGSGATQTDGAASLKEVNVIGQQGADGANGVTDWRISQLDVVNIYAETITVEGGSAGVAGTNAGEHAGNGALGRLNVEGNVVGNLVVMGGSASAGSSTVAADGGDGVEATATISGNFVGSTLDITGGAAGTGTAGQGSGGDADRALVRVAGNIEDGDGDSATATVITLDDGANANRDGDDTTVDDGGGLATLYLNGDAAQTVTGSIFVRDDGDGRLAIDNESSTGGVTITGDVGSSTAAIRLITQYESAGTTFGGDVYAKAYSRLYASKGDTDFNGNVTIGTYIKQHANVSFAGDFTATVYDHSAGDLSFDGENAQTVTVMGSADDKADGLVLDKGNISIDNASGVTFANAVTLSGGNITIAEDSIATFGNNISMAMGSLNVRDGGMAAINSALTLTSGTASTIGGGTSGTLQINDTLTVASGTTLNLAEGSTLALGITEGTAIIADGTLDATGPITLTANSMQDGDSVIVSTNGLEESDFAAVESTNFVDYEFSMDNGSIILTAGARSTTISASELGLTPSELERFQAAFNNSTNTAFSEYVATISGDDAALVADQTAVQEETLSASAGAISGAVNQVASITADRLASLRTGDGYGLEADQAATGFATGDGEMNRNIWGKFFYSVSDQDSADNADGYEADTTGFAVGSDTEAGSNMRIGVSLAMSQSDVDGKGGGDAQTDIDSYQLTAYGDLTRSDYFVDWQAGAATSSVETSTVVDPASGISGSNSDYDSMTYFARVGAGMPIDMSAEDTGESARFTPYGSFGFQRISSDSYNLLFPDDPGLNQRVSPDDVDELSLSLGGRYTLSVPTDGGGILSPQVRGALSYNFIGNTAEATSTYADGTELTVKGVEAEKFGASLVAGITYASDTTSLGFDIDSTLKDGYASYTGTLNFRLQF